MDVQYERQYYSCYKEVLVKMCLVPSKYNHRKFLYNCWYNKNPLAVLAGGFFRCRGSA